MTAKIRTMETSSKITHATHKIPFCHSYAPQTRVTSPTNAATLQQTAQQLGTDRMAQEMVSGVSLPVPKRAPRELERNFKQGP